MRLWVHLLLQVLVLEQNMPYPHLVTALLLGLLRSWLHVAGSHLKNTDDAAAETLRSFGLQRCIASRSIGRHQEGRCLWLPRKAFNTIDHLLVTQASGTGAQKNQVVRAERLEVQDVNLCFRRHHFPRQLQVSEPQCSRHLNGLQGSETFSLAGRERRGFCYRFGRLLNHPNRFGLVRMPVISIRQHPELRDLLTQFSALLACLFWRHVVFSTQDRDRSGSGHGSLAATSPMQDPEKALGRLHVGLAKCLNGCCGLFHLVKSFLGPDLQLFGCLVWMDLQGQLFVATSGGLAIHSVLGAQPQCGEDVWGRFQNSSHLLFSRGFFLDLPLPGSQALVDKGCLHDTAAGSLTLDLGTDGLDPLLLFGADGTMASIQGPPAAVGADDQGMGASQACHNQAIPKQERNGHGNAFPAAACLLHQLNIKLCQDRLEEIPKVRVVPAGDGGAELWKKLGVEVLGAPLHRRSASHAVEERKAGGRLVQEEQRGFHCSPRLHQLLE
mmetsp:Transcript_45652/g.99453  ORF Transcript_45652/g.99453 Transcript_45652/m.99453 type:complete len:497 (-) Transcript_45652:718-2208(-)